MNTLDSVKCLCNIANQHRKYGNMSSDMRWFNIGLAERLAKQEPDNSECLKLIELAKLPPSKEEITEGMRRIGYSDSYIAERISAGLRCS